MVVVFEFVIPNGVLEGNGVTFPLLVLVL